MFFMLLLISQLFLLFLWWWWWRWWWLQRQSLSWLHDDKTSQAQMDLFYYIIFWLQSFFIVLPFGMIGRHFLEFWTLFPMCWRNLSNAFKEYFNYGSRLRNLSVKSCYHGHLRKIVYICFHLLSKPPVDPKPHSNVPQKHYMELKGLITVLK